MATKTENPKAEKLTCAMCGLSFDMQEGRSACANCGMRSCNLLKCPRCGYEQAPPARLGRLLGRLWRRLHGAE